MRKLGNLTAYDVGSWIEIKGAAATDRQPAMPRREGYLIHVEYTADELGEITPPVVNLVLEDARQEGSDGVWHPDEDGMYTYDPEWRCTVHRDRVVHGLVLDV